MTNAEKIRGMTDEELEEYLYCYGICAHQDECDGDDHAQEFCLAEIVKWLGMEANDV